MERGKKRKRNLDLPRIAYHASERTFERLFKEESLGEMETVVRRKLRLPDNVPISLSQLRGDKSIDLEDDDDFDAFYSIAHSMSSVNVGVTVVVDVTPSSGSTKVLTKKKKTKTKTVSAGKASLNFPHSVEHEQIVVDDEIASPSTTAKETDKPLDPVVRSERESDVSEGTSRPCKKRRKENSTSVPIPTSSNDVEPETERVYESQAPLVRRIDGKRSTMFATAPRGTSLPASPVSISPPPTTIANDQCSSKSKNAKRKKRLKEIQGFTVDPAPGSVPSPPTTTTDSISMVKRLSQNNPKTGGAPFAEQLAGAISETAEHNRKHSTKVLETGTRRKGQRHNDSSNADDSISLGDSDAIQREKRALDGEEPMPRDDVFGMRKKKANSKSRASTIDELEAANADVKAAFSRILAAKRASLTSSLADISTAQISENTDTPRNGQPLRAPEAVTPQPTFPGKGDTSQYSDVVSEPFSSKSVVAEGALKGCGSTSDLTTSHTSSRSSEQESEHGGRLGQTILSIVPKDASSYADIDLGALIRGPKVSAKVFVDDPSSSSEDGEHLDLAEDDGEKQTGRRGRKTIAPDSSEEEDTDDDDDGWGLANDRHTLLIMDSRGISPPHSDGDRVSFQMVDRLGESQEVDDRGDIAFRTALAADTAVFKMADHKDPAHPVLDCVTDITNNNAAVIQSSQGITNRADSLHLVGNLLQPEVLFPHLSPRNDTGIPIPESETTENQRREGIIRRMKDRSGKYSAKCSVAGSPTEYDGLSKVLEPDSMYKDDRGHTQGDRGLTQQPREQDSEMNVAVTVEVPANLSESSMSLDTWTTLKASSPLPDVDSTIMIDELQSSSPNSRFPADSGRLDSKQASLTSGADPLFILTESQLPFPYSQWSSQQDRYASNDTEGEREVQASIQSRSQPKIIHPPKYRRLTEIASQRGSFSTPTPNLRPAHFSSNKLADMYGRPEDIDSESSTESDSDSDAQVHSHIPKSRIAGSRVRSGSSQAAT